MRRTQFIIIFIFAFIATSQLVSADVTVSTLDDQKRVEVTVYNNNLGLVKDTRQIKLPEGEGELRFMDVAAFIMPVTVHAKSLNAPQAFNILEQNYEYDLIDQNKLLDKYVGKKVKLIQWNEYQDRKDEVEATLISNNNGEVYKIGDEIYLGYPGLRVLPELPENLIAKPTLMWLYRSTALEPHALEVSYLTNNLNWKADYVLVINDKDTSGDLSGWVTIDNTSGATYNNAKLKLVAGEVQRIQEEVLYQRDMMMKEAMMASAAPGFVEQGFFEYHIYDLQRPTTIKDRQTKQISLLEANGVGLQKEFLVYGEQSYYTYRYNVENPKQPVQVYIKFKNSEANHLGMPLPAGVMRLYKEDSSKSLQFIGEDRIVHTPKDEEVKLKVGEAFDVVAERVQTDFKQITNRMFESAWEITLRNHKEEDITVSLIEPVYGHWELLEQSHPSTKVDAFTLRFDVPVAHDGEVKVKYRVRVGI